MKKTTLFILLLALSLLCGTGLHGFAQTITRGANRSGENNRTLSVSPPNEPNMVPGILYIQLKTKHGIDFEHLSPSHTGNAELDNYFSTLGVSKIYPFDADAKNYAVARRHGIDRMYVINFPIEGNSPRDIADKILTLDAVEKASPRLIAQKCYTPNDPDVPKQYALDKMHIKDAWGISKGSANIIIADIDEGVNYTHEDLAANIYKIDGHFGYNVVGVVDAGNNFNPTFDPMPSAGFNHGTMTSGCFGAVVDNNKGGAGTGFNCKIMAIRISDSIGTLLGGWEGIHYAVEHGAKIINCSWGISLDLKKNGDKDYFDFHQAIIDEALDTGALVVAAAGNAGVNIDVSTFVPAAMHGVLSVGATDQNDNPAGFSNYGHAVNVYAPGVNIFSTSFPGTSAYDSEDGTSFSCPLTSGVAGLVWFKHTDWLPQFVARQIIQTSDNVVRPADRTHFWGRVNAYNAVSQQPSIPGLEITDFTIDGVDKGSLQYSNKQYSLNVTFKNILAQGSGIQAVLVPATNDGTFAPNSGYTVEQGSANLGTMNSSQSATGSYKFTRDGTDNGAGTQLELFFAISYGNATVEGRPYFDTLPIYINISGDGQYVSSGVGEHNSFTTQLGVAYPNPVSGSAVMNYEISTTEYAKISICDVLGRTLNILSEGIADEGQHQVHFDSKNLEDGVYFAKLETAEGTFTKRIVVVH